jgi:hypothetical protein
MGDQLYALEKLVEAVQCLATGPGRVQERLAEAMTILIRISPEDVPPGRAAASVRRDQE